MLDGFIGAIIGAISALAGIWLQSFLNDRKDEPRKKLLKKMLEESEHDWRELETLCRVIGADKAETARLLVSIGARGSEGEKEVWALISKQPIPR